MGNIEPETLYLLNRNPCQYASRASSSCKSSHSLRTVRLEGLRDFIRLLLSDPRLSMSKLDGEWLTQSWFDSEYPIKVDLIEPLLSSLSWSK